MFDLNENVWYNRKWIIVEVRMIILGIDPGFAIVGWGVVD